jgi:hypothetical protein
VTKRNRRNSNATKHGLLAAGITELDDAESYCATLRDIKREKNPVGVIEQHLVESIGLHMMRLRRAARLEGEYITDVLNPPIRDRDRNLMSAVVEETCGALVDPGSPAPMQCGSVQPLVSLYQRYMTAIEQQLYRALHELERLQRMRRGEHLPAPAAVDVTVHAEPHGPDAFGESSNKPVLEGSQARCGDEEEEQSTEAEPTEQQEDQKTE